MTGSIVESITLLTIGINRNLKSLMKQIHIVGISARTGTTLMAEAMKACFDIDSFQEHEDRLFFRPEKKYQIHLSKAPFDMNIVRTSLFWDSNLYVICMIRDPRDIICSTHKMAPDYYWTGLRQWKIRIKEFDKSVGHPRFIPIKYEDLVTDPNGIQKDVYRRIPFLNKKLNFSDYDKCADISEKSRRAMHDVRPINNASIGRWQNHKPRIAGQIMIHGPITNDLIRFGYENNEDWLKNLGGIKPDLTPSYKKDISYSLKDKVFIPGWDFTIRYLEALRRVLENKLGRRIKVKCSRN
jgi:hypothetical protein